MLTHTWTKLTFERRNYLPDATLGIILLNQTLTGFNSLELPWLHNRPDVSCIPEGIYYAVKHQSPSKGPVIWIMDVPDRTWIYMHVINTILDSDGCIGPGTGLGHLFGLPAIMNSKEAFNALYDRLPDRFTVEITSR